MTGSPGKLLVITGEVSGDIHTAGIIKALKQRMPDMEIFGIGGPRCIAEGLESSYDIKDMAVVGIAEVLSGIVGGRKPSCLACLKFDNSQLVLHRNT